MVKLYCAKQLELFLQRKKYKKNKKHTYCCLSLPNTSEEVEFQLD